MIASSVASFAQHSVGSFSLQPKVGVSLATLVGDHAGDPSMKFGLVSGVEAEYQATDLIGVAAGLNYSMQGANYDDPIGDSKLEYINIPVVANFYVAKNFALKLGVQPGFLVSAKSGKLDVKDHCKTFDFSIPVGASYEISNFVIDARYNFGLTAIPDGLLDKVRNSTIQLTVGYRFDL